MAESGNDRLSFLDVFLILNDPSTFQKMLSNSSEDWQKLKKKREENLFRKLD
jgi:hypothetical protein